MKRALIMYRHVPIRIQSQYSIRLWCRPSFFTDAVPTPLSEKLISRLQEQNKKDDGRRVVELSSPSKKKIIHSSLFLFSLFHLQNQLPINPNSKSTPKEIAVQNNCILPFLSLLSLGVVLKFNFSAEEEAGITRRR